MSQRTYSRYLHTLRHLKLKQVCYRLYYACTKTTLQNGFVPSISSWISLWSAPEEMRSSLKSDGTFTFLGQTGKVSNQESWNDSARSKLWLYNLHYFDAMNSFESETKIHLLESLLERWVKDNPPLQGVGWEPYPLSLRIVNWVKWFSKYPERVGSSWLESLALQAQALSKRIEHHILANHLFANAKALVFAGTYFEQTLGNSWFNKGLSLLDKELSEQFLDDGGHYERSPMYHSILLWDVCDLYHLASCSGHPSLISRQPNWRKIIMKGVTWLQHMTHPDGEVAFFNDTALGIAPTYAQVVNYAHLLGVPVSVSSSRYTHLLKESGYVVINDHPMKVIVDVGEIGPGYQPGHAHADTLSFELSLFDKRIIVNSGISEYGEGPLRQFQRGTEAHNTVSIDGKNSSDVWAGFRVGKRAYPCDLFIKEEESSISISCAHDGYKYLPGKNIHHRGWKIEKKSIIIHDRILGGFNHAEARFFLHPAIHIIEASEKKIVCTFKQGIVNIGIQNEGQIQLQQSAWYPYFGKMESNYCVVIHFKGNELITKIEWHDIS